MRGMSLGRGGAAGRSRAADQQPLQPKDKPSSAPVDKQRNDKVRRLAEEGKKLLQNLAAQMQRLQQQAQANVQRITAHRTNSPQAQSLKSGSREGVQAPSNAQRLNATTPNAHPNAAVHSGSPWSGSAYNPAAQQARRDGVADSLSTRLGPGGSRTTTNPKADEPLASALMMSGGSPAAKPASRPAAARQADGPTATSSHPAPVGTDAKPAKAQASSDPHAPENLQMVVYQPPKGAAGRTAEAAAPLHRDELLRAGFGRQGAASSPSGRDAVGYPHPQPGGHSPGSNAAQSAAHPPAGYPASGAGAPGQHGPQGHDPHQDPSKMGPMGMMGGMGGMGGMGMMGGMGGMGAMAMGSGGMGLMMALQMAMEMKQTIENMMMDELRHQGQLIQKAGDIAG